MGRPEERSDSIGDRTRPGVADRQAKEVGWRKKQRAQQGFEGLEVCVRVCGGLSQAVREPHGQDGSLVQLPDVDTHLFIFSIYALGLIAFFLVWLLFF